MSDVPSTKATHKKKEINKNRPFKMALDLFFKVPNIFLN